MLAKIYSKLWSLSHRDIIWRLCLLLAFVLPLNQFISVRLAVCMVIFSFSFRLKNSFWPFVFKNWDILFFISISLFGLLYTSDFSSGFSVVETSFSLVAFPLIFRSLEISHDRLCDIFFAFTKGIVVSSSICLVFSVFSFAKSHSTSDFLFYQFTQPIDFQPTYFAYYLVFAITFSLYRLKNSFEQHPPKYIPILILFLFFVLILTGGRTSFISMLLVFSFFVLVIFFEDKTGSRRLILVLILIMMASMFGTTIYERGSREVALNDSWDRYELWQSAISANDNVILGVGTGDQKLALNQYFMSHDMHGYASSSLNSHSQFIQIYLSNGLLGLAALICLLARPLYISFIRGFPFGILVFFPFVLYGVTEVFLGRYQGVVFFAFLQQSLISYFDSSKPVINLSKT